MYVLECDTAVWTVCISLVLTSPSGWRFSAETCRSVAVCVLNIYCSACIGWRVYCKGLRVESTERNFTSQVTVLHRNKFIFNKTNRRTNFPNLFCQETLHVSGSSSAHHQEFLHCTFGTGICHTGFMTAFKRDHLVVFESSHETCMTYTSAECTVENSWWWAEELPETCRVSWQK